VCVILHTKHLCPVPTKSVVILNINIRYNLLTFFSNMWLLQSCMPSLFSFTANFFLPYVFSFFFAFLIQLLFFFHSPLLPFYLECFHTSITFSFPVYDSVFLTLSLSFHTKSIPVSRVLFESLICPFMRLFDTAVRY
jgi:hypothetical protein